MLYSLIPFRFSIFLVLLFVASSTSAARYSCYTEKGKRYDYNNGILTEENDSISNSYTIFEVDSDSGYAKITFSRNSRKNTTDKGIEWNGFVALESDNILSVVLPFEREIELYTIYPKLG